MRTLLSSLGILALLCSPARAQCRSWSAGFAEPGSDFVYDSVAFDAGAGEQIYVCGYKGTPGNTLGYVDRWNGRAWENVYANPMRTVRELAVGTVAGVHSLFACETRGGGGARGIMRWNGTSWADVGVAGSAGAGEVNCLEVLDDGSGAALYLGGSFTNVDGIARVRFAKWDGASWSLTGTGLTFDVASLTVHDAGGGPRIYAGSVGSSTSSGSVAAFNGTSWSSIGGPPGSSVVESMVSWDWGAGPRLVVASPTGLEWWDGATWILPGNPGAINSSALRVADLGSGPRLYVNGFFNTASGLPCSNVASFNGTSFTALGSGVAPSLSGFPKDLTLVNDSGTPKLLFVGQQTVAGGLGCRHMSQWDGANWSVFGRGFDDQVRALARYDVGAGEELFAAGSFTLAGEAPTGLPGLARWDGMQWRAFGSPGSFLYAVAGADLGTGPRLYATGQFNSAPNFGIGVWDGNAWSSVGGGIHGEGFALLEHDDGFGPRLFVGGNFPLGGPGPGNRIAAWNGTSWSNLAGGMNNVVSALAIHDEGNGRMLFAGGTFTNAGGTAINRVARWNGVSWSGLDLGVADAGVNALCSFDDGSGPMLYAGGTFTNVSGTPVSYIARWNGTSWSDVPGGGASGAVLTLAVHDDGRRPALYVGGGFTLIGGIAAYNLARFDGTSWEAVDGGADGVVRAFCTIDDDGDGDRELYMGGDFQTTGSVASGRIARLEGCPHYESFCFGDGTLTDHTTPCPCANDGAPGHGCANPFDASGALLAASGQTNPETLVLAGSGMPLLAYGLYLQHDAAGDHVFHDGVLCAAGNLIRLRNRNAFGGVSSFPDSTDTVTISQRGMVTPGSGALRYYSLFYRSASPTFCPPATANVTNGVRVIW